MQFFHRSNIIFQCNNQVIGHPAPSQYCEFIYFLYKSQFRSLIENTFLHMIRNDNWCQYLGYLHCILTMCTTLLRYNMGGKTRNKIIWKQWKQQLSTFAVVHTRIQPQWSRYSFTWTSFIRATGGFSMTEPKSTTKKKI